MELLLIVAFSLPMIIILVVMGVSYIEQGLKPLKFNGSTSQTHYDYYQNPLYKINSKYFHYRPKGSVIVSKNQWKKIEKNIGLRIADAIIRGKKLGRKETIAEIQDVVDKEKSEITPSSPYLLLGVKSTEPLVKIEKRWQELMDRYDLVNFKHLDPAFLELARIRRQEFVKAWNKIRCGVGESNKGGKP